MSEIVKKTNVYSWPIIKNEVKTSEIMKSN